MPRSDRRDRERGMHRSDASALRLMACVVFIAAGCQMAFAQARREARILPGASSRAPIQIQSANLEFVDGKNAQDKSGSSQVVYSGNVVARQGDSTLTATTLTILLAPQPAQTPAPNAAAPTAPAASGPANGQIRRMDAAGPVTIASRDQTGRGDRGVYDKAENKVYLIGNVSLAKGAQITRGGRASRLIYDLDSGHAQMVGGVHTLYTPGGDAAGKKKK